MGAVSESTDRPDDAPLEAPDAGAPASGAVEPAPSATAPADAPRPSRFSRSESGEWTARRTSDEPFPTGAGAALAAGAGAGVLVAEAASDPSLDDGGEPEARARRRRRPRTPRMWLQGGTSTQPWGWLLVGWALISLGLGVIVATTARELIGGALGGWIATTVLWVAMIVPVVLAFRRSVPRGLLRFRATDLLFGLVFGVALRFVAGGMEQAASGGTATWPSYPTVDGQLAGDWWFGDVLVPIVIAPGVEEFFFHGLLLVAMYTAFRRLTRVRVVAGFGAALISTGLFVLLHQLTGSLGPSWSSSAAIALVGLAGATLVLLTGRIWGAVLLHVFFNASYVLLALVGTLAGMSSGVTFLS